MAGTQDDERHSGQSMGERIMQRAPQWRYTAGESMIVLIPSARARQRGRPALVFCTPEGFNDTQLPRLNRMSAVLSLALRGATRVLPVLVAVLTSSSLAARAHDTLGLVLSFIVAVAAAVVVSAGVRVSLEATQAIYAHSHGLSSTRRARIAVGAIRDLTSRDRDLLTRDGTEQDITDEVRERRRWEATRRDTAQGATRPRPTYGLPGAQLGAEGHQEGEPA